MEQKLNIVRLLTRNKTKLGILMLLILLVGCKNENDNSIIKIDYQNMITKYDLYYGMDFNNPKKTMDNLNAFIKLNSNRINNENINEYVLEYQESDSIIIIRSMDFRNTTKIPLKIDLNKRPRNYCQNTTLSMSGFFSKSFKILDHIYLYRLNNYLKSSFNDSVFVPAYSIKESESINRRAIFKYNKGNFNLLCSTDFSNREILNRIQDSLSYYLEHDTIAFDYALIPIVYL